MAKPQPFAKTPTTETALRPLNPWRQVAIWLLAGLVGLGVGFIGYKAVRIGIYTWRAYDSGTRILTVARNDPQVQTLAALQPEVAVLSSALSGLEAQMQIFMPLLNGLDGWTVYGSTLAATPELVTAGAELSALAAEALEITAPALVAEDGAGMDALVSAVEQHEADFPGLAERAARANRALLAIPAAQIHPTLATRMAQVQTVSPMLEPALRSAPVLPKLLGMQAPVTYIVLFQNNHELRGTGGFISAVGELTVSRGRIDNLTTADSYEIYSNTLEYSPPPDPMRDYLMAEILVFRDANWSPDLPTSGRTARHLYEQIRASQIDGVITVDLNAVQTIIDGLGGIEVEGVEEKITGTNVVNVVKQLWGNPLSTEANMDTDWMDWWKQRKDFVPTLAAAMLDRVESGQFNPFALLAAGKRTLDDRSIQIWLDDPVAMEQLAALGWDGALHPVPGADYLALVDSNVGFNKVNAVVTRSISYRVTWPDGPGQPAQAVATVTYQHPIQKPGHVCDQTPRYGDSYDDMIHRCFFNYVRLYVPRGSQLIGIEGVAADSITSQRGEALTQVLAGFFEMKPGEQHTVTFTYQLPATLQPDTYRLIVQRQAGTGPLPLDWQIGDGQRSAKTIAGNWIDWSPPQ